MEDDYVPADDTQAQSNDAIVMKPSTEIDCRIPDEMLEGLGEETLAFISSFMEESKKTALAITEGKSFKHMSGGLALKGYILYLPDSSGATEPGRFLLLLTPLGEYIKGSTTSYQYVPCGPGDVPWVEPHVSLRRRIDGILPTLKSKGGGRSGGNQTDQASAQQAQNAAAAPAAQPAADGTAAVQNAANNMANAMNATAASSGANLGGLPANNQAAGSSSSSSSSSSSARRESDDYLITGYDIGLTGGFGITLSIGTKYGKTNLRPPGSSFNVMPGALCVVSGIKFSRVEMLDSKSRNLVYVLNSFADAVSKVEQDTGYRGFIEMINNPDCPFHPSKQLMPEIDFKVLYKAREEEEKPFEASEPSPSVPKSPPSLGKTRIEELPDDNVPKDALVLRNGNTANTTTTTTNNNNSIPKATTQQGATDASPASSSMDVVPHGQVSAPQSTQTLSTVAKIPQSAGRAAALLSQQLANPNLPPSVRAIATEALRKGIVGESEDFIKKNVYTGNARRDFDKIEKVLTPIQRGMFNNAWMLPLVSTNQMTHLKSRIDSKRMTTYMQPMPITDNSGSKASSWQYVGASVNGVAPPVVMQAKFMMLCTTVDLVRRKGTIHSWSVLIKAELCQAILGIIDMDRWLRLAPYHFFEQLYARLWVKILPDNTLDIQDNATTDGKKMFYEAACVYACNDLARYLCTKGYKLGSVNAVDTLRQIAKYHNEKKFQNNVPANCVQPPPFKSKYTGKDVYVADFTGLIPLAVSNKNPLNSGYCGDDVINCLETHKKWNSEEHDSEYDFYMLTECSPLTEEVAERLYALRTDTSNPYSNPHNTVRQLLFPANDTERQKAIEELGITYEVPRQSDGKTHSRGDIIYAVKKSTSVRYCPGYRTGSLRAPPEYAHLIPKADESKKRKAPEDASPPPARSTLPAPPPPHSSASEIKTNGSLAQGASKPDVGRTVTAPSVSKTAKTDKKKKDDQEEDEEHKMEEEGDEEEAKEKERAKEDQRDKKKKKKKSKHSHKKREEADDDDDENEEGKESRNNSQTFEGEEDAMFQSEGEEASQDGDVVSSQPPEKKKHKKSLPGMPSATSSSSTKKSSKAASVGAGSSKVRR